MKTRVAVFVLVSALASAPAQAGWFGGQQSKKLPQAITSVQHLGHYAVHPARVKPGNRADSQEAGRTVIRKRQQRPVTISHPYLTSLR